MTAGTSDHGLAVVSWGNPPVVEWGDERKYSPAELKDCVERVLAGNPRPRTIVIETNNGGDRWANLLRPITPPPSS